MNRVRKFRAYDKITRKRVIDPMCFYMSVDDDGTLNIMHNIIVCDFTSFFDKNNVEMFEGDLFEGFGEGSKYCEVRIEKGEIVVYNNFGKWGTLERYFQIASSFAVKPKVVGNIYENPELLS